MTVRASLPEWTHLLELRRLHERRRYEDTRIYGSPILRAQAMHREDRELYAAIDALEERFNLFGAEPEERPGA